MFDAILGTVATCLLVGYGVWKGSKAGPSVAPAQPGPIERKNDG